MININLPANALYYQSTVVSILNVEIITPELTTEKIWDMSRDYEFIDELANTGEQTILNFQIMEIGFDTFNPILNVGGYFIFLAFVGL